MSQKRNKKGNKRAHPFPPASDATDS